MEICLIGPRRRRRPGGTFLRVNGQSASELTGVGFSPDGTRMYFSSQRGTSGTGITYEVAGPFRTSVVPTVDVVDDEHHDEHHLDDHDDHDHDDHRTVDDHDDRASHAARCWSRGERPGATSTMAATRARLAPTRVQRHHLAVRSGATRVRRSGRHSVSYGPVRAAST